MKVAYQIFTVLLWVSIILAGFFFVKYMSLINSIELAVVIGALLGVGIIPGIIWVIRFFIGKEIKK